MKKSKGKGKGKVKNPLVEAQKKIDASFEKANMVKFKKPFFVYAYYNHDRAKENVLEIGIKTWGDLLKVIKSKELTIEGGLEMALISVIMQQTGMLVV